MTDFAAVSRQRKVLAMVAVIDADAVEKKRISPFDQAGRIWLASRDWSDATWLQIAKSAGYKSEKTPGQGTRAMVREVYEGRAKAPVSRAVAS